MHGERRATTTYRGLPVPLQAWSARVANSLALNWRDANFYSFWSAPPRYTAFLYHEWMCPSPTLTLTLCLLLSGSHALGPRVISQEEILTVVDDWLYAVDEDEDGSVSEAEAPALLDLLKQGSSAMGAENFGVDVLMRMADGDGDKVASRAELIDFLKRMKATRCSQSLPHDRRRVSSTPPPRAGF